MGNLSTQVTSDELRREFTAFGKVTSITIMSGRTIGDLREHAFVEMQSISEGEAAIAAMNGAILRGRRIEAIQALPLSRKTGHTAYHGSYGSSPRNRSGSRI